MPENPFYVYALKDPRQKPAKPLAHHGCEETQAMNLSYEFTAA